MRVMDWNELSRWTPGDCRKRNGPESVELDGRVRLIDWTEEARRPGSRERLLVAGWMEGSGILEEVLHQNCHRGTIDEARDWLKPRMFEKVAMVPVVSNPDRWNLAGMWDPDNGGSFCGWVRHLSAQMLCANIGRELARRPKLQTDLPRDGEEEAGDALERSGVVDDDGASLAVLVPRPMRDDRGRLRRMLKGSGDVGKVAREMRRMGLWDRTLDRLDEGDAVGLMLSDLKPGMVGRVLAAERGLDLDDALVEAFARTQTRSGDDGRALAPLVERAAERNGCDEWTVWLHLGSLVAACV